MVEVDVKIQAGDLYDYLLMHTYNGPSGLLGSCFGALLVVIALLKSQWIYLIAGIVLLLYLPWTLFVKSRRQALNPAFLKPLHYVLDDSLDHVPRKLHVIVEVCKGYFGLDHPELRCVTCSV